jgi:hypothetical protein
MAPSRSTPQMMQVTRAAFQAVASLNEQATDPKSHTLVKKPLQDSFRSCYLLNSDGRLRIFAHELGPTAQTGLRHDSDHRKRWFKKTIHSVSVMASPDNFLGDLFAQIVQLIFQSRRAARQGCFVQLNFAPKCGITAKTSGRSPHRYLVVQVIEVTF